MNEYGVIYGVIWVLYVYIKNTHFKIMINKYIFQNKNTIRVGQFCPQKTCARN